MRLSLVLTPVVLGAVVASSLSAQIPDRGRSRSRGPVAPPANATKVLVANPHVFTGADSAAAVQIGGAMRTELADNVGRDYAVIPQAQMNEALVQFGYPKDAILSPAVARSLANTLQAPRLVTATMNRGEGGRYVVTARYAGTGDDAGSVVVVPQAAGQSLSDFGKAIADRLEPAIESHPEARSCMEQRQGAPDKAAAAARKAIEEYPNNGLAHYCLAELALAKKTKADSAEATKHLQEAVQGDPLSLAAWTKLSVQYQLAGDTANTVRAFSQMLLVAPTNQKLREEIFRYFLQAGLTKQAEQVAEQGLALDSTNADLWDLKANACIFANNYKCAVDALEQVFALDSAAADTTFFLKITATAAQQPDTARLLEWARKGARKYPDNTALLEQLANAYTMAGQTDSALALNVRLFARDTVMAAAAADSIRRAAGGPVDSAALRAAYGDAVLRALATAQTLVNAKRTKEALPYAQYAVNYGDPNARENAAVLLTNIALPLFQEPRDLKGAADILRQVVKVANPGGKIAPIANYYLGLATFLQIPEIDPQAEKQKSCDLAKQEEALLAEAGPAFQAAAGYKPEDVARYQKAVEQYNRRVASMIKAYCK
ncbi:MAG TPA: hypothetical protein VNK43_10440 [Gemmatimonadales bacterium]|nr:hypothetical protein [Gemmatimonadales bacterium]